MRDHLDSVKKRLKPTKGRRKTSLVKSKTLNTSVSDNFSSEGNIFNSRINGYRYIVNRDLYILVKPDSYLYAVNRHNGDNLQIGFIVNISPVSFDYLPSFDVDLSIVQQTAIQDCLGKALETDNSFYEYCQIMGINKDAQNKILYAEINQWSLSKRKRLLKRAWKHGLNTDNIAYDDVVSLARLYIKLCNL